MAASGFHLERQLVLHSTAQSTASILLLGMWMQWLQYHLGAHQREGDLRDTGSWQELL